MCGFLRLISAEFSRFRDDFYSAARTADNVPMRLDRRAGGSAGSRPVHRMRPLGSNKHDDLRIKDSRAALFNPRD